MKKLNIRFGQIFILLAIFTGFSFAQTVVIGPTPKPKPTQKPTPKKEIPIPPPSSREIERVHNDSDIPFEKSIEVDSEVNFRLCISEGNVRINGWERDEIRIFVKGGTKAGFRPGGKNSDGQPTSVTILGYDPLKDRGSNLSQCLAGEEIELDVPKGANLAQLNGPEGEVRLQVESIAKVRININQGDIQLRNIEEGIYSRTNEGNISAQDSFGTIELSSTNGDIFVYNVDPLEDSDILKIRTNNGMLTLQSATHLSVDLNTISGAIRYSGQIQTEGQYSFRNTSGDIILGIPNDTSCTLTIVSGKDKFSSDLPFKINNETVFPPSMKKLIATMGDGEANMSLQTQSGVIKIRKQN